MLRYGSVCSGIEAASVAWAPLGWRAQFLSEIEPFPRAVLAHRHPGVPLHGDFTTIGPNEYGPIDLLVGGTPCQSFSLAGLRGGMADARGNLALEYLRLADRLRPRWLVWENVPGVLSSRGGRDFGSFLAGLGELGYGYAYRVFDAQYFGLAQRRKRVFVIGHLGDWRCAAAVLFEPDSLRGHPAPRREAGSAFAGALTGSLGRRGGQPDGGDTPGQLIAKCLTAHGGPAGRMAFESETFITHTLRGEGFDASEDGTGRGTPLIPVSIALRENDEPARAQAYGIRSDATRDGEAKTPSADAKGRVRLRNPGLGIYHELAPTLDANAPHAVAFNCMRDTFATDNLSPTVPTGSARGQGAVAVAFQSSQSGVRVSETHATLDASNGSRRQNGVVQGWAVRRLTPRECERLQGFPDDYTLIPWRKGQAKDGPRYKAIGNSMAVPVMRWIGERIALVEKRSDLFVDEQAFAEMLA